MTSSANAGKSKVPHHEVSVFAGIGTKGANLDPSGDPTKTQLNGPGSVSVFPDGRVVIADTFNHRVLTVSSDGKKARVLAGTGEQGSILRTDSPTNTQLYYPYGVAALPDGRVVMADTYNHRVLVVASDGESIELFVGSGEQGGSLRTDSPTIDTRLSYPIGVAAIWVHGKIMPSRLW